MKAHPRRWIELETAFDRADIVVVCWHPGCSMHRLKDWSEDDWEAYPRKKSYGRYSHGICIHHYREYAARVDAYLETCPIPANADIVPLPN